MVILEVRIRTALEKLEVERIKKRIKIESLLSSYIFVKTSCTINTII